MAHFDRQSAWPHPTRLDGAVGLGRRDRTSQRLLVAFISAAVRVALGSSRFALSHADAVEQSALPTAEDAIENVSLYGARRTQRNTEQHAAEGRSVLQFTLELPTRPCTACEGAALYHPYAARHER